MIDMEFTKHLIINKKLCIRELSRCDAPDVLEYASDEEFCRHIDAIPYKTIEQAEGFINSITNDIYTNKRHYWGICYNNKIYGTTGFLKFRLPENMEVGFAISRVLWGKGIVNQCVEYLIEYAFEEYDIEHLLVGTRIDNIRSQRFIEKFAFDKIGIVGGRLMYRLFNVANRLKQDPSFT